MTDPFTRASPTYQAAIRHPHKTGSAWEGYSPRPQSGWWLVAAAVVVVVVGLGVGL